MDDHVSIPSKIQPFEYSLLPREHADLAGEAAIKVRGWQEMQIGSFIEIGKELLLVRERLKHGLFGQWLKFEFNMSDRTARNYMQVAETLFEQRNVIAKLSARTVYALAAPSFPLDLRDQVIAELETGSPNAILIVEALVCGQQKEKQRKNQAASFDSGGSTATASIDESSLTHSIDAAEDAARLIELNFNGDLGELVELLKVVNLDVLLSSLQRRLAEQQARLAP